MPQDTNTRRTFLKVAGSAGAGVGLSTGTAAAGLLDTTDGGALDLTSDVVQEALVVFETHDDISLLDSFGLDYYAFEVLPIAYVEAVGALLADVAALDAVRSVEPNRELDFFNDDARKVTGAATVQNELGYAGKSVHVGVIDSGVDGDHPDLSNVENNYEWVGNPLGSPTLFVPVGPLDSDEIGHGTHCSGSVAGDGTASDGKYEGMAPEATLTVYSTSAGVAILKAVAAYDHLLANHADEVDLVSNSYGSASGADFDPDAALNVATWQAHEAGLLSMFAAGNAGPKTNTLNDYAKAPHVLGVAATTDEKNVTGFSSRGRTPEYGDDEEPNYDREAALSNLTEYEQTGSADGPLGIYRLGVGAPGYKVVSTMSPADPLQAVNPDTDVFYAAISGTSMACPVTVGVAALVVDAYQQNGHGTPDPIDVLNTVEATADDARSEYTPYSIGTGFVDAVEAVERAESGDLATFDEVTLV